MIANHWTDLNTDEYIKIRSHMPSDHESTNGCRREHDGYRRGAPFGRERVGGRPAGAPELSLSETRFLTSRDIAKLDKSLRSIGQEGLRSIELHRSHAQSIEAAT